jgi:hypothetical protein
MEAAGAVDAKNAPTAPWKTHRTGFPRLPHATMILANAEEVTAKRCHVPDREALSLRRLLLHFEEMTCPRSGSDSCIGAEFRPKRPDREAESGNGIVVMAHTVILYSQPG